MQILELPREVHPFFIGVQFHPELTSRPLRPSPLFVGLVKAALERKSKAGKEEAGMQGMHGIKAKQEG
jgi:CTP synthase